MAAVWMIALIITSPIWITAVIIEKLEAELIKLRKKYERL